MCLVVPPHQWHHVVSMLNWMVNLIDLVEGFDAEQNALGGGENDFLNDSNEPNDRKFAFLVSSYQDSTESNKIKCLSVSNFIHRVI